MRFLVVVVLVACGGNSNSAAPHAERKANSCTDAPAIAGSEIVYCEGGMSSPDIVVAGPPLVVGVSACCAYAIVNGDITPLVTREILADLVIAGGWLYVSAAGQSGHPAAITRVTLDGSKRETLLTLGPDEGPLMLAVAGGFVYVVIARYESTNVAELRLLRIPIGGGKATSAPLTMGVAALAVREDRVLLLGGHDLYEVHDLETTHLATVEGYSPSLAVSGHDVYVGTSDGVYRLTDRNTLERVATGTAVRRVAASPTHVAWIDGDRIMAKPVGASGQAKQLATFREEAGALAIDGSAVYWSVPYYYAPDAKTVEERLHSQKVGFVARTPLR